MAPNGTLSMRRQCALLAVTRSSVYYEPVVPDAEELALMRRIDELHLQHPFFGSRMITQTLKAEGPVINRKRVQRLMRLMGLESTAPQPTTSTPAPDHPVYPYLLRGLTIARPNQALAMKRRGFEHPAKVGHQDVVRGRADRPAAPTQCRRPCRLPPRIHTGAGAGPHAADPLHAIRPTGGDRLGATHRVDLRRAKGPPASSWSTFAYSNSVSISSSPILACSRRWSASRASGARLFRPACPAARN